MHVFTQIEDTLSNGYLDDAQDLLETLDPGSFNTIETNYFNFYVLYLAYTNSSFTTGNLDDLVALASLCPGTNGLAVYQARTLYLLVTGRVFNAPDNCGEAEGSRIAAQENHPIKDNRHYSWNLIIYPNPASNQLNFRSEEENETLTIEISDLSGRSISKQFVQIKGFIATLDLNLMNGAYLITISSDNKLKITKKLLIAK